MAVVSIPIICDFMDTVAQRLLASVPLEALADVTVWVPSPRQGVALAEALKLEAKGPLILPRILPLHLPEDIPETIEEHGAAPRVASTIVRQMFLTRLLLQKAQTGSYAQAWHQAGQLAQVLDDLSLHGVAADAVQHIVRGPLAAHWQQSLDFLDIILTAWPAWLAENQRVDAVAMQQERLHRLAAFYASGRQVAPVWAVGFADTTPAGMTVLRAIAAAESGVVVLPGWMPAYEATLVSDAHMPLQTLVAGLEVSVDDIKLWDECPLAPPHLSALVSGTPQEEAAAIALVMRDAWEARQTCALVTPDRALAQRVQAELGRWQLVADDSAGTPLLETAWGQLLQRLLKVVVQRFHPLAVAEFLHHPFVQKAFNTQNCALFTDRILKGPVPDHGLAGLRRQWQQAKLSPEERDLCDAVLNRLADVFQPLTGLGQSCVSAYVRAVHAAVLVLTDAALPEEFMTVFDEAVDASDLAGPLDAAAVSDLLFALCAPQVMRPPRGEGRLFIWGPLEARLQTVDRVVLGGLVEGVWPIPPSADPWLNQTMRAQLGLPDVQRKLGLAAHDFWMLRQQREVFFSRSSMRDGLAVRMSRLWERWEMETPESEVAAVYARGQTWQVWAKMLLAEGGASAALAPVGQVPLSMRPQQWSASSIERLMICPYRYYADKILKLPETEEFAQPPEARDRGALMHTWLQAFFEQIEDLPPPFDLPLTLANQKAAEEKLSALAEAVCASLPASVKVVWLARFLRLVPQLVMSFIDMVDADETVVALERKAEKHVRGVLVHARADRVDQSATGIWLVDYKTGGKLPSLKDVALGQKPQLAVEAWLQHKGAYVAEAMLAGVSVWHVPGGSPKPLVVQKYSIDALEDTVPHWLAEVEAGLERLVAFYQDEANGYSAVPSKTCDVCAYAGVCRKEEWQLATGEEG